MNNALFVVNFNHMICLNQRASFEAAAERWDADYIEITEQSLEWSYHTGSVKLIAFSLCDAKRLCILDADTIIRSDCPSPFEVFDKTDFVAVVNKQEHMPPFYLYAADMIQPKELELIMAQYPVIDFDHSRYFNTGFIVADRKLHQAIFDQALGIFTSVTGLGWWDQSPLNYCVQACGVKLQLVDTTWNYCMPPGEPMIKWIYHFAGIPSRLDVLRELKWQL